MVNTLYKRGRTWWWKYRPAGETGKPSCVSLGVTDRVAAEKIRSDRLVEIEREMTGVLSPRAMRETAGQSFGKVVNEYLCDVRARGRASRYVDDLESRLFGLSRECGWSVVRDATAESYSRWRSGRRGMLSAKTLNEYLNAVSGFFNWLMRCGRVGANPFKHVGKVETRGRETRFRRAATVEEVQRLVSTSGERGVCYLMMVFTGLRCGELAQLDWADVHLDAGQPFVEVRASTTKNHQKATIALHSDVVAALTHHRRKFGDTGRVFTVPKMPTFRADLKRAGIEYTDERGRVLDRHALRVTLCTWLQQVGTPPRIAQELLRHSTPDLTARVYTDTSALHTWKAVNSLPSVMDGLYQGLYQEPCAAGQQSSLPVTGSQVLSDTEVAAKVDERRALAESGVAGQSERWWTIQDLNL